MTSALRVSAVAELHDALAPHARDLAERAPGCIEGNVQIPIGQLRSRAGELHPLRPLNKYFPPRYSSAIAASALGSRSLDDVAVLSDGCQARAAP